MSITINGATNTLTAAAGLTVAGNTAVTGALSATGTVTAVTDLQLGRATGGLNLPVMRFTSSATAPFVAAKGDNIVVGCQGSGEVYIAVEDVTKATISSTGLAVTGALSATGLTTLTGGALIPADGVIYGNAIAGPNYNRIKMYNAGTGDIEYYASFPTGSHKFYQGATDTLIGTFSSTGLTLGTGVNLVVPGNATVKSSTATPAGGEANTGLFFGTSFMAVLFGSGAPSVTAAKGSLYLRSDGSGTNDRMYINTDGSGGWTAVVTVA